MTDQLLKDAQDFVTHQDTEYPVDLVAGLLAALTSERSQREAAERERNAARARATDAEARLAAASVHEAKALVTDGWCDVCSGTGKLLTDAPCTLCKGTGKAAMAMIGLREALYAAESQATAAREALTP